MEHNIKNNNLLNLLSDNSKQKIDVWIRKFPEDRKQSALIAGLFIAQEQNNGYLTADLVAAVADYLNIPRITAEESATFYSMYEHKPVGKYKICVCTNLSCMLCGSKEVVKHLEKRLGISFKQTTADGKFTLKEVECLGACTAAPMMQIGSKYYENLTIEKIDNILNNLE
ncbi:MAG: NAD(P)H-dependent oxidoreductase subunit E [Gammaproteobacteria bacterium]|nr:NAD(P)H-dependent oxidoreductase subunit E [Gammaproteobacteria bacterium]